MSDILQSDSSDSSKLNSSFIQDNDSYLSATSNTSMFIPQKGGNFNENNSDSTSSVIKINLSASSNNSIFIPQKGGHYYENNTELTSSVVMPQKGGRYNKNNTESTSSVMLQKGGNNDVNNLISMLTSDSNDKNIFTTNSTATEELENKLRNML